MGQLSVAECDRIITSPGQYLEMQEVIIEGRKQRVWKNLPRTFRDFLISCFDKYHFRPFINAPIPPSRRGAKGREREQVTFAQVLDRALGLAAELKRRHFGVGSRIGIAGNNSVGWVVSFVAIHLIGGIPVCFNTWLAPEAIIHCLRKTTPVLILSDEPRAALLAPLISKLRQEGTPIGEVLNWDERRWYASPEEKVRIMMGVGFRGELGPESDAMIFFSSGGLPKAVLSTQRMALSNILSGLVAPSRAALRAGLPIPPLPKTADPQKTVLLAIPLFHVTGCLSWLMRAFFGGSRMVYMDGWSADEAVRVIASEKVTVIGGVPAVVSAILHHPALPSTQTFETVFYGGAPPGKKLAGEVKAKWPKAGLVQGYGLTETCAYMTSIAGQDYVLRPESTGICVPIASMRIADPDTRSPLPVGQTGLLLARGPQVMKEYYNDPEETAKAVDDDGWLDTGDIGYIDEEGFLYIKDRLKDIIIRGGENIATLDVENALLAHPSVSEAVAVGVDDARMGEVVGAMVSLHGGKEAGEDEVLESVKPILGRRAWPVIILISREPLPRNVNGKVVKKDLKPIVNKAWKARQSTSAGGGGEGVRAKL